MRTATISPVRRVAGSRKRLAEQRPGAFGRSEVRRRKHGEHGRVIATDLDEGHASVDQARDHVGELLTPPGDEDGAVSAEIAFQQSIGFFTRRFADRTLGPKDSRRRDFSQRLPVRSGHGRGSNFRKVVAPCRP
ncbi:hypothetical protein [Mesorhizobium sp. LSJC255A00]|uniref:hypothetical protein n=1 Tax=Mesorhizobium sp. LSJC255A00 TaxID=1287313 RepID=UPI0012EC3B36|nr:hypothetical protein [Mesorhizobium sp. LSJC255A00]